VARATPPAKGRRRPRTAMRRNTQPHDLVRESVRCQRPGRDNRELAVFNSRDLLAANDDPRFLAKLLPSPCAKTRPRSTAESMSGGNGGFACDLEQQRSRLPHFFLQQPRRGVPLSDFREYRADQFREIAGLVSGSPRAAGAFRRVPRDAAGGAHCHAASDPARPAPITCTFSFRSAW